MKQGGIWHRRKLSIEVWNRLDVPAGARLRPASTLEGSRLCGKESSSPEPESGEQWTPFSKVNLVPEGKKIQGARKPSTVLSADVCLSVCLSSALCVCVCAGIISGLLLTQTTGQSAPTSKEQETLLTSLPFPLSFLSLALPILPTFLVPRPWMQESGRRASA